MPRPSRLLLISFIAVAFTFALSGSARISAAPQAQAAATTAVWPPPIDPQMVRDQYDMTWDDYVPIPGTKWNDPSRVASVKTIRLAIICADFPDQPFVMTLPKNSDKYGNPQVDPIKREDIKQYTQDYYTKPQPVNHGHTIHEYWMEQSRGKVGVDVTTFGPYRMPSKTYQYGGGANMPFDEKPSDANMQTELDKMWADDAGADIRGKFDLVMRLYAGYDESSVWQEFGEMKFQTKEDITPEFGNPDPSKPRFSRTRYVEWTSWDAAKWLWSNSAIITGEASGAIRHEVSHAAFRIGDNYNNPYVTPYRRVGSGPWDLMDRGSFNGPGGPHKRYLVPKTEGDVMSAGIMLRQKIAFDFVTEAQVLTVKRDDLAKHGLVVANVTARAIDPLPNSLAGIVVRLDDAKLAVTGASGAQPGGGRAGGGRAGAAGGGAAAAGGGAAAGRAGGGGAGAVGAGAAGTGAGGVGATGAGAAGAGAGGQGAGRAGGRGAAPEVVTGPDRTPVEDPVQNPLWSGNPNYNFFSMEVVQRMGYDSYTPDNGVLIAKNKDQSSTVGGPNAFSVFNWVIDAHPEDINTVDFKRPDGTPVMRTIADYRQLNDALFHAGTNSGSKDEWTDDANKLQFYVIDRQKDSRGVLSYTLGARSLEGSGDHKRGVAVTGPASGSVAAGATSTVTFNVKNTGTAAPSKDGQTPAAGDYTHNDIYRVKVSVDGEGWTAALQNQFTAMKFGETKPVQVVIKRATGSASSATVTVTATSESDPTKTSIVKYAVK